MEKEVSLSVKCPLCDGSLMDESHPICKKPSVKINIETEHDRGVLRLCCIFGNCSKTNDVEIAEGEIVSMFCPHCNKELSINENCEVCEAPLISLVIKAGGKLHICSRNGCANHHLVFKEISQELLKFYHEYGF